MARSLRWISRDHGQHSWAGTRSSNVGSSTPKGKMGTPAQGGHLPATMGAPLGAPSLSYSLTGASRADGCLSAWPQARAAWAPSSRELAIFSLPFMLGF